MRCPALLQEVSDLRPPDETPESFADPKPPEVRMLTPEQAEQRYEQLWEWFGTATSTKSRKSFGRGGCGNAPPTN